MNKETRDGALAEYWEMHALWRANGDAERGITGGEAKELRDQARVRYFESLPVVQMSVCPICNTLLLVQFDPWGFDGFWWQERELGLSKEPLGCQHFQVLTGAVALGDSEPLGGNFEAHIGPDLPFLIPAVLELPTMTAVISSLAMETGATAFPIAYFASESPPSGSLSATWRRTSYSFKTPDGKSAWTIKNDPWDFDLRPWIDRGKLRWTEVVETGVMLADPNEGECPFLALEGKGLPQVITEDRLHKGTLPNPDVDPDPFTS